MVAFDRRMRAAALSLVALTAIACSKNVPRSGAAYGTELAVSILGGPDQAPAQFRLTAAELGSVEPHLPDVSDADEYADKCGVPPFVVQFFERGAIKPFAEGHFFHGPGELMLSFEDRAPGRLRGQARFHAALVDVIRKRGYLP